MVIKTDATFAYKCYHCGMSEFVSTSLFRLVAKGECYHNCICGMEGIHLFQEKRGISVVVPCINCGDRHTFHMSAADVLHGKVHVLECPSTDMHCCVAGDDKKVRQSLDAIEAELEKMLDHFGYECHFKNSHVMLYALNRIHDIAEKGGITCSCGSRDVDLNLLEDRVVLICGHCGGTRAIQASSNRHLRSLVRSRSIRIGSRNA